MVDLAHGKCKHHKCNNQAIHNFEGIKTRLYCKEHELDALEIPSCEPINRKRKVEYEDDEDGEYEDDECENEDDECENEDNECEDEGD